MHYQCFNFYLLFRIYLFLYEYECIGYHMCA